MEISKQSTQGNHFVISHIFLTHKNTGTRLNKQLKEVHFGFKKQAGTKQADLTIRIYIERENNKRGIVLFLDQEKSC